MPVEVIVGPAVHVEVVSSPARVVGVPAAVGPPGPPGLPGGQGVVYEQTVPLATWTISHPLGRRPAVAVYVGDEQVEPDLLVTTTQVVVVWPQPTAGTAVLT